MEIGLSLTGDDSSENVGDDEKVNEKFIRNPLVMVMCQ
jgi:hypothetical protein